MRCPKHLLLPVDAMGGSDHSVGPNEETTANEAAVGEESDLIRTLTHQRIPASYHSAVIDGIVAHIVS